MLLLVVSETGLVYTFTTPKLQPLVTKAEGKNLIQVGSKLIALQYLILTQSQACLNAPEPAGGNENGVEGEAVVESPEEPSHPPLPPQHANLQQRGGMQPGGYITEQQQRQAIAYQNYMAQQQQQVAQGSYPMPPQAGMAQHPPQA